MNTIRQQIINICINSDAEGIELVKLLEAEVAKLMPYQHDITTSQFDSCGLLDVEGVQVELVITADVKLSELIEKIEQSMTKREMTVGFFQLLTERDPRLSKSIRTYSLQDFLNSMTGKLEEFIQEDSESLNLSSGFTPPNSPNKCDEDDQSECWRCPHKKDCVKFD